MKRSSKKKPKVKSCKVAQEQYYSGNMTTDQYVDCVLASKEGDNRRRRISGEFRSRIRHLIGLAN